MDDDKIKRSESIKKVMGLNLQHHREKVIKENISDMFNLSLRYYNAGLTNWCRMLEIHSSGQFDPCSLAEFVKYIPNSGVPQAHSGPWSDYLMSGTTMSRL